MSQENKPCPFCGSSDIHSASRTTNYTQGFIIVCGNCKAEGPLTETRRESWEKWNKRDYTIENRLHSAIESLNQKLFTERYDNKETIAEKDAMINWLVAQLQERCDNVHICIDCNNYYRKNCKHPLDKCHNNRWLKAAQEATKKND